ncbi:hypothetical protein HOR97_gp27 [Agrobacterium phage Atu_ph03]|uniref:Uncharacterized protein n=1 Tax=Agrobacterium phage Atu_ph03 TaxID=2024262 RepID=A0A2L0UZ24_9CAUD|nr:hypothetical protein HOR97_gp27 [Agrobacterium phage Atu_ph03]AUZ94783.1 hypothetical protein [Agrobacterium phage Atu_ph03]
MCDPITALIGLAGVGASLAAASAPIATPPPAALPAIAPPTNVKDTEVKLGSNSDANSSANTAERVSFVERRVQGTSLGSLGRSGLAL